MQHVLAAVVMSVTLAGGFGQAGAEVTAQDSESMTVQLVVTSDAEGAVVAHVIDPGGEQMTIPMAEVGDRIFRGSFEFRPADLLVVFEDVESGEQTDAVRLTELGASIGPAAGVPTSAPGPEEPADDSLGWLALGLGAASLSLLAFWVLGGSDRSDDSAETPPGS